MKPTDRETVESAVSRRAFLGRSAVGVVGLSMGSAGLSAKESAGGAGRRRGAGAAGTNSNYSANRAPLVPSAFVALPLGSVAPRGWLRHQLEAAADGLTGRLDEVWPDVDRNNGWLGGSGDVWERGPYWLDGLLPLAYTLRDERLIGKARTWVEWSLQSQQASGDFGPVPDTRKQRNGSAQSGADWWPKMVMLKVLQQYHEATGDARVPELMTRYFRYQQKELPSKPLNHWSFWARERGGDNLASIHWLYNRTGEPWLLELGELVRSQTVDWTKRLGVEQGIWHGVNTGMGIKQPGIVYQQTGDAAHLEAIKAGLKYLEDRHGQVQGLWSGDELLHGTDPSQGTETCTVVEYMYSLEQLIPITGDLEYADRLEKLAFNALPAPLSDDHTRRQYYQTPNQIACTEEEHNFATRHSGDNLVGLETGYGCCTANLHQGWPKFTAHLWMATPDNGLAAMLYAPSEVTARVADGVEVRFVEETDYPFDETIRLAYAGPSGTRFPLHLRIPGWAEGATLTVNGRAHEAAGPGRMARVEREWSDGDMVELVLPMKVRVSRWHERSTGVERGPLVFALGLEEEWTRVGGEGRFADWEVRTSQPWNYGILREAVQKPEEHFTVRRRGAVPAQPWTLKNAPIEITVPAKRIAHWTKYNGITGPIPWSFYPSKEPVETITLVPYGSTKMRIAQFPGVR